MSWQPWYLELAMLGKSSDTIGNGNADIVALGARFFEKGLVDRAQGTYYVEPERADERERRLDSLDATARLFETAPDDDYAEPAWEDEVPSIDPDENRTTTNNDDARTTAADADELVSDLVDADDGA